MAFANSPIPLHWIYYFPTLTPFTGSDLLAKVKELGDASKADLERASGYVSSVKNGSMRLNFTVFYEAPL